MIITGMEHFQDVCKKKLVEWYNKSCMIHEGQNAINPIDLSNVFIVWSCKTLQNYKCLASTTLIIYSPFYLHHSQFCQSDL